MIATGVQPTSDSTRRRIPGEPGTWVFLFGDMLVFGVFFITFSVQRAKAPEVFDVSRKTLHIGVGLTNTLVLLISSLCMVIAMNAIRAGARSTAAKATATAMACALAFVGLKVFEYHAAISVGHGSGYNDFFLYYYILTGLHLLHVCVGTLVLMFVLMQARRTELSATRMGVVEGATCFWHLVDMLWIVLFPLLYMVS